MTYNVNVMLRWVCAKSLQSCPTLYNPRTVAHQAPLSMQFSRQEHWSSLLCPPPAGLPDPEIKPASLMFLHWQANSLPLRPPGKLMLNWGWWNVFNDPTDTITVFGLFSEYPEEIHFPLLPTQPRRRLNLWFSLRGVFPLGLISGRTWSGKER